MRLSRSAGSVLVSAFLLLLSLSLSAQEQPQAGDSGPAVGDFQGTDGACNYPDFTDSSYVATLGEDERGRFIEFTQGSTGDSGRFRMDPAQTIFFESDGDEVYAQIQIDGDTLRADYSYTTGGCTQTWQATVTLPPGSVAWLQSDPRLVTTTTAPTTTTSTTPVANEGAAPPEPSADTPTESAEDARSSADSASAEQPSSGAPADAASAEQPSSGASPVPFLIGGGILAIAGSAIAVRQRNRRAAAAVATGTLPQSGMTSDDGGLTLQDLQQYAPESGRDLGDYDDVHAAPVATLTGPDGAWDALVLQEHELQQKIESDFGKVVSALTNGYAAFVDRLDQFRLARAPVISATTEMDRSLVVGQAAIQEAQTVDFLWAVLNLTRGAAVAGFKASKWLNAPSRLPTVAGVTGKVDDSVRAQDVGTVVARGPTSPSSVELPKDIDMRLGALEAKHGTGHVKYWKPQLPGFLRLADEAGEDPWLFLARYDDLYEAGEALSLQVMRKRGWHQIEFEVEWTLKRVLYNVASALEGRVAHIPHADIERLRTWSRVPGFWEALPKGTTHTMDFFGENIGNMMLAFDSDQIRLLQAIAESEDLGAILSNVPDALKAPGAMQGPILFPGHLQNMPGFPEAGLFGLPPASPRGAGRVVGVGPGGTTMEPPSLGMTLSQGGVNPFGATQVDGVPAWATGAASSPQRGVRPYVGPVDPSAPTQFHPGPPVGFNPEADTIIDAWETARGTNGHSTMRIGNNLEDTWVDLFPVDRTWTMFPVSPQDDVSQMTLALRSGPGHTLVVAGDQAADIARRADPSGSFTTAVLSEGEILYGPAAIDAASLSGTTVIVHGSDTVRGAMRQWREAPPLQLIPGAEPTPIQTWFEAAIGETLTIRTSEYVNLAKDTQSTLTGVADGKVDTLIGSLTEPGIGLVGYPGVPSMEPPPITITPTINLQSCESESLRTLGEGVGLDADLWTQGAGSDFVHGFNCFLGELAYRRGWHPIEPETKLQLDRLILDSRQWATGGAAPADGDLMQLNTWVSRPGFFPWMVSSVAPGEEGLVILYNVDDVALLQSVVAADGDIDALREGLGPIQMQSLMAISDTQSRVESEGRHRALVEGADHEMSPVHVDPQQLHYWKVVRDYMSTTRTANMGIDAFLRSFGKIWEMDGPFHYWFFGQRSTEEGWHSEFLNTWWAFFSSPIETWTSWYWTAEAHEQFKDFSESQREHLSEMAVSMASAVRALEDMQDALGLMTDHHSGLSAEAAAALVDVAQEYKKVYDAASPRWQSTHRDEMIKRRSHILNKLANLSRARGPLGALATQVGHFIDWLNALRLHPDGDARPAYQLIGPEVAARMGSVALALRSLAAPGLLLDSGAANTNQEVGPWDSRNWMTPEERERRQNAAFERAQNPETEQEAPVTDGWGNPVDIVPDD